MTRVTQIKVKNGVKFVGVDASMNTLIRPALYNAVHEIHKLPTSRNANGHSRSDGEPVTVCGPICESADVFVRNAPRLADVAEDDVLLIAQCGAYAHTMAMAYNMRPVADEFVI